ncbi:PaaI family thioesterase [Arthrobacter sp. NEB 688]|nr:PaaI family thioesterase [Arthrobacter sp. NEB 688]
MQRVASGLLPPPSIATLLGMDLESVEDGTAVFVLTPDERMLNPLGTVHGGVAATLLDSCMGCAVHTTLPAGADYTTAQLTVHYLRPMRPGTGPVRAVGTVLHRGRTQSTAEGRLLDAAGRLLAHASTTCLVRMP